LLLVVGSGIIEMHGGKIQGVSQGEGKGSTFFIDLPLYSTNLEKSKTSTGGGIGRTNSLSRFGSFRGNTTQEGNEEISLDHDHLHQQQQQQQLTVDNRSERSDKSIQSRISLFDKLTRGISNVTGVGGGGNMRNLKTQPSLLNTRVVLLSSQQSEVLNTSRSVANMNNQSGTDLKEQLSRHGNGNAVGGGLLISPSASSSSLRGLPTDKKGNLLYPSSSPLPLHIPHIRRAMGMKPIVSEKAEREEDEDDGGPGDGGDEEKEEDQSEDVLFKNEKVNVMEEDEEGNDVEDEDHHSWLETLSRLFHGNQGTGSGGDQGSITETSVTGGGRGAVGETEREESKSPAKRFSGFLPTHRNSIFMGITSKNSSQQSQSPQKTKERNGNHNHGNGRRGSLVSRILPSASFLSTSSSNYSLPKFMSREKKSPGKGGESSLPAFMNHLPNHDIPQFIIDLPTSHHDHSPMMIFDEDLASHSFDSGIVGVDEGIGDRNEKMTESYTYNHLPPKGKHQKKHHRTENKDNNNDGDEEEDKHLGTRVRSFSAEISSTDESEVEITKNEKGGDRRESEGNGISSESDGELEEKGVERKKGSVESLRLKPHLFLESVKEVDSSTKTDQHDASSSTVAPPRAIIPPSSLSPYKQSVLQHQQQQSPSSSLANSSKLSPSQGPTSILTTGSSPRKKSASSAKKTVRIEYLDLGSQSSDNNSPSRKSSKKNKGAVIVGHDGKENDDEEEEVSPFLTTRDDSPARYSGEKNISPLRQSSLKLRREIGRNGLSSSEHPSSASASSSAVASPAMKEGNKQMNFRFKKSWELGLKILLVDDSPPNRKMLKKLLTSCHHIVYEAKDGLDCLELLNYSYSNGKISTDPSYSSSGGMILSPSDVDVILMDDHMPRLTGPETTKILKLKGFPGLIYAITGTVDEEEITEFLHSGVEAVFSKPLNVEALKKHINDFYENHSTT
jgi:CheY-like chemotaxis protein